MVILPSIALNAQETHLTDSITTDFVKKYPNLDSFYVDTIIVKGNDQTNRSIILRELKFKEGNKLPLNNFQSVIKENQQLVMNTQLFVKVSFIPMWKSKGHSKITIKVSERWYTFPRPVFNLADRNFNEWWVNRDRDLSRTVYGLKFYQENIRGRNEQLKASFTLGFTEEFSFQYNFPFIDSSQTWGLQVGSNFTQNKKMTYGAKNNDLEFHEADQYIRRKFNIQTNLIRRKYIRKTHTLGAQFHSNWVSNQITTKNSDYFGDEANVMRYFSLKYEYKVDYRDRINYPKTGYSLNLGIEQKGLGIFQDLNQTFLTGALQKFWPLGNNFFLASEIEGQYSFSIINEPQPFFIRNGLGFNQTFVRGYEYDVILGNNYLLNRNSIRYQVFETEIKSFDFIPIEQFRKIPLGLYFKVYGDQGFVSDQNRNNDNPSLRNTYLAGSGVGMDIVTYYDIVFRIEYSFKKTFENDLFLHFVKAF